MKPFGITMLAACALLNVPARAAAQPLFRDVVCVESAVLDADVVAVGTVAGVEDGPRSATLTLAVQETLKGEHRERLRVQLPAAGWVLAEGRGRSTRWMLAVKEDPREGTVAQVIELSGRGPEVMTADLTPLKEPEDITRAAREAIRRMPGVRRIETFRLRVPPERVAGTRWRELHGPGVHANVHVPVDERLEERALRSLRSESFLDRQEGVEALRFFRSGANVARGKALLDDPGWSYLRHAQENMGREIRVFGVRRSAYETLKYWGMEVGEPVTREEHWKPELVRYVSFSGKQASDADLDGLARFRNLEGLGLRDEPVTDARLKRLAVLRGLRSLDLTGTGVTDAGLKELAGMAGLRDLGLRGTKVTGAGLRDLAGLKALAVLDLSHTGVTDAALGHVAGLTGLRKLDLAGTRVSAEGIAGLVELRPDLEVGR